VYVHELDAHVLSRITPHQSPAAITPFCGKRLFGPRAGYTRLLALEEAGAHDEYLFQRGELRIANLEDVTRENNPVIRYEARRGA